MRGRSLPVLSIHRNRVLDLAGADERALRFIKPTPKKPMIISASELRDFLRCRVRWAWKHQHRIVPRERAPALALGDLGHKLLAKWYQLPDNERTTNAMKKIVKNAIKLTTPGQLSLEDVELVQAMCIGYSAWAKPRDKQKRFKNIVTERFFELPLVRDGRIIVRGFIDATFDVTSLKKTVGCLEHKFKGQIRIDSVDLNLQLSVYLWALRKLIPKRKQYIAYYNVLRKQMPGPRVKADLFARESIDRTEDEIEQWTLDTERIAYDMLDASIYPNPMDSCSWDCDYQTACLMRGRPNDLRTVLERDFMNKDGSELEVDHAD